MTATLISATARHTTIIRSSGRTEYSVMDDNTNRKIAHVSVIRGFAHLSGTRGAALFGFEAVIRLDGPELTAVQTALAEGIKNGRDDRN